MAGKKRDDKTPRTKHVVQVCLDDSLLDKLMGEADVNHNGKLSVAARALLQAQLADAA